MQRFRHFNASAAWLMLLAIVLGGELIETHSHDEHTDGKLGAIALSSDHDLPDDAANVDSVTSLDIELCPACVAGQRLGTLDASQPTSRLWAMVAPGVHSANGPVISGSDARLPSPRGPPTV